jgi:aminopeptidase N
VLRDRWNDVDLAIYYHPGHEYNLAKMMKGIRASLDYCTRNFSPYQNKTVRIVEFPRYELFAQSFPASIPYSEGIGFIARVDPADEEDVDYPFYVTAHEVAHQWWAHQVIGGDVQGATVMSESLAQYTAVMVMKHEFGPEHMKRFLKYEMDKYLGGRSSEKKQELPLIRCEGQGYIRYNKASVVFYALQDYVGEEVINRALRRYVQDVAFQEPPYTNALELEAGLRAVMPAQYGYLIDDMFDAVTLYENRALSATYRTAANGKYEVKLKVAARKLKASEQGEEREVPLADWIDIGVFDAKEKPLYLRKHKIEHNEQEFTLQVDAIPVRAGIDPWNKLVDRSPDDNTIKVERQR